MKQIVVIIIATCFVTSCNPCKRAARRAESVGQPDLQKVVSTIQSQYTEALDSLEKLNINNIEISEAKISLKVTKSIASNGELNVLIFTPSAKYTRTASTTITYTLSKSENLLGGAKPQVVNNNLRDMIVSSAVKLRDLNTTIGNLTEGSFELDLVFSIEVSVGAVIGFEIWGVGVNAGAEKGCAAEHGMVLSFNRKND